MSCCSWLYWYGSMREWSKEGSFHTARWTPPVPARVCALLPSSPPVWQAPVHVLAAYQPRLVHSPYIDAPEKELHYGEACCCFCFYPNDLAASRSTTAASSVLQLPLHQTSTLLNSFLQGTTIAVSSAPCDLFYYPLHLFKAIGSSTSALHNSFQAFVCCLV